MPTTSSCLKIINDYFKHQVEQGLEIPEVVETFKQPVLPSDLKIEGYGEDQIRRCAQLVSTQWIIKYNKGLQSVMDL
jgi:hypothetical protein